VPYDIDGGTLQPGRMVDSTVPRSSSSSDRGRRAALPAVGHGPRTLRQGTVLVVAVVIPGQPLPWLVWTVAVGCLAMAGLSIAVGVGSGLGCAMPGRRAAANRRRPTACTAPGRQGVIDGILAEPDPTYPGPMDGR
jgi:hypothetical protein